jgi:hypothetical protein
MGSAEIQLILELRELVRFHGEAPTFHSWLPELKG